MGHNDSNDPPNQEQMQNGLLNYLEEQICPSQMLTSLMLYFNDRRKENTHGKKD